MKIHALSAAILAGWVSGMIFGLGVAARSELSIIVGLAAALLAAAWLLRRQAREDESLATLERQIRGLQAQERASRQLIAKAAEPSMRNLFGELHTVINNDED